MRDCKGVPSVTGLGGMKQVAERHGPQVGSVSLYSRCCGPQIKKSPGERKHHLAAEFNRPGHELINHWTWFVCSDGDLMEGVSHEAASFAGHFGLGKLIGFYDDNRITI
ncbi:MAG: hypothetical protein ACYC3Q_16330, partial [Gemmatimonadaceae bacterium]